MPHHRRALDDRHSFAPLSRFLGEEVLAALEVVEVAPGRAGFTAAVGGGGKVVVDLDPLWA
jgi:DNA helicase-2/ATP-dependent DNA helicase PcrA